MSSRHFLANYMSPFFNDYLAIQRGLSHHTILAYRDALKLLFCFGADIRKKAVDKKKGTLTVPLSRLKAVYNNGYK